MFRKKSRRESFVCTTELNAIESIHDHFLKFCADAKLTVPKPVETVSCILISVFIYCAVLLFLNSACCSWL